MNKPVNTSNESELEPFASKLSKGADRFLARILDHGIQTGVRHPGDFIRHFPPADIMDSLAGEADMRGAILEETTGLRLRIAVKKTAKAAGQDLQMALDESETDADTVVGLYRPDDQVRFLEATKLWSYGTESKFWDSKASNKEAHAVAANHIRAMLKIGFEEKLLTCDNVVEGVGPKRWVDRLPAALMTKVLESSLSLAVGGKPFSPEKFMDVVGIDEIIEHIPLPIIWSDVIVPHIAENNRFADVSKSESKPGVDSKAEKAGSKPDSQADTKAPPSPPKSKGKSKSKIEVKTDVKTGPPTPPPKSPIAPSSDSVTPSTADSVSNAVAIDDDVFSDLDADDDLLVDAASSTESLLSSDDDDDLDLDQFDGPPAP